MEERYTFKITMPEHPVVDDQGRWQPTRITARAGWKEITPLMRLVYVAFVMIMAAYNIHYLKLLPDSMSFDTMFGLSGISLPTAGYMIGSVILLLYLIYRDLIRRSMSRYRLFVPLAVLVMNTYFVTACIPT